MTKLTIDNQELYAYCLDGVCALFMIRTLIKRDLDSGGGLQTSGKLRFTDGGSAKPLGDLTHPAISGFYNAPYCKAVVFRK